MFRRLRIGATALAVLIGVCTPPFWLGQYVSDQNHAEGYKKLRDDVNRANSTIQFQADSANRALREQRIEILEEKNQEIARIMLMCRSAATESKQAATEAKQATESAKGVLDTVKETKDAQVETIRDALDKVKK